MVRRMLASALVVACLAGLPEARAQEPQEDPIPFADGTFTITETEDLEKVLAFDGREIARDYVVYYDRTVDVGGTQAALFDIGPGGNACATSTLIIWKPDDSGVQTARAGDDCGSPPPAVTDSTIYFVPYLLPGASASVQSWTPEEGLRLAGALSFVPQPGTGWSDLDPGKLDSMIDALSNEAVYQAAQARLGDDLTDVVTGLIVSGGVETLPSETLYGSGCVPHACGSANAFMAADPAAKELYFAQQDGAGGEKTWPALGEWPDAVKKTMTEALAAQ